MKETMVFAQAVRWVLDGGSAMLSWWIIRQVKWFGTLTEFQRWAFAFAIPCALSTLVFYVGAAFGYFPMPSGVQAWVETMFPHYLAAVVAAKTVYEGFKAKKA